MPTSSPTQSEDSSPGYLCRGRTGAVELGNEVHLGGVNCVATVRICRSGETLGRTPRAGARYRPAAASSIAAHRACGRRDVHAAQGGIPARGVSGKNEANGGIVFAKGMPDLKLLAHNGAARRRESRKSQTSLASFAGSPHQQDTPTDSAGDRLGCRRSDLRKSAGAVISPTRLPHPSPSMPERAPAPVKIRRLLGQLSGAWPSGLADPIRLTVLQVRRCLTRAR
jgi:hypothetical protein